MKYIITLSIAGAFVIGFILGNVMADPTHIKTVEKEVVVNPSFEFEPGDKTHCEIGTEVKPCEIIAKKSNGSYAVKYHHSGIAAGDKIIMINPSSILK